MLDNANKYTYELKNLYLDTWYDDKYKFYYACGYSEEPHYSDSNLGRHDFVSLDKNGNIIGYISYGILRYEYYAHNLSIVNFSDNILTFGRDLREVISNIFEKYNLRKLQFMVVVGNPIEKSYDKLIQKYGGRIVGEYKKHRRLIDGNFYNAKAYEIFREDYLANIRKGA